MVRIWLCHWINRAEREHAHAVTNMSKYGQHVLACMYTHAPTNPCTEMRMDKLDLSQTLTTQCSILHLNSVQSFDSFIIKDLFMCTLIPYLTIPPLDLVDLLLHPHYVIHVHANKISHARLSEASYLTCTVIYHNKGLTCKCSLVWIVKLCSGSVKQRACLWKWYLILELEPIFGPFRCSIGFNDSLRIDHKDWKRKSSDNMWICYLHLQ